MRIYNGTKSMLDLPLTGMQRLSIPPHAVSGDFMPTNNFLSLLVTTFDYSELAVIVSGPYEISMCAGVPGSVGFVVQTLEEAIERFSEKSPEVEAEAVNVPVVDENPEVPTVEEKVSEEEICCDNPTDECSCVSFNNNEEKKEEEAVDKQVIEEVVQPEVKKAVKKATKKNGK